MKLLLLAGTAEARALAERLAGNARFDPVASLAGATDRPAAYAVALRVGGFGGDAGFEKYCRDKRIEAIVDATHPFARVMPRRAQAVAARLGLRHLRLLRPGWVAGPGDDWRWVEDARSVTAAVPPGARVFLATGRQSLDGFAELARGRHLIVRVIDPPQAPFPFAQGGWLIGRPPFSIDDEIRTLRDHRIGVLVVKDSGGPTAAKLEAARALGLPVVMIRRPPPPPGARVENVEAALEWLERLP
ncbi:MAG: cobalt-precorrin-6A reductase [Maritimibacter sp.]|nr:cobalt-precorrin-6A reductase [Maritimibacter sp.]